MREFDLLADIIADGQNMADPIMIGPGDDMGSIRIGGDELLIAVDQVVDGVHVDIAQCGLSKAGRKVITRNLSDVAAMGAEPVGAVCAANLPRSMSQDDAEQLLYAVRETGEIYRCPVFGGDVSVWDGAMSLSVTVLAQMAKGCGAPIQRLGAQPGDGIYVTDELGGAMAVMSLCDEGSCENFVKHLDFQPRLKVGVQLAKETTAEQGGRRPTAMIDLSDGLAKDLSHIVRMNKCAAELGENWLPIGKAAQIAAKHSGKSVWEHAVGDGEDYELLFTGNIDAWGEGVTDYFGVKVTRIGQIVEADHAPAIMLHLENSKLVDLAGLGWEHGS
ncbi:thiamine-phosphate kinase [Poriferisphaera sp. WC338]|uniref:thiamine-phosphate kinase n=1 Tax=Poriferisphaera sp. WC338 TaxID=3425129 RepID=UPI003D819171